MDAIKRVNSTMRDSLLRKVKMREQVLDQFRKGKLTVRQGAELLGISYMEMNELLRDNHVPLATDISTAVQRKRRKAR